MATRAPGRTLGEEQAYQQGRVDGRRDCLLALGGAFGKVLEPDSLSSLAKALREGLALNPPARSSATTVESSGEKVDPTDPTEPANWPDKTVRIPQRDGGQLEVYAVSGCIFNYCPHPEQCRALESRCATLKPASGGVP